MLIPVDKILAPKIQLRLVNKSSVDYFELRDSVRLDGILQPLLVRPLGDKYEVVEGNWRLSAAKELGLPEIPCLVKDYTDDEVEVIQLKTNAIRPKTGMADFANRLHDLMDRRKLTLAELAALVNKGVPWLRTVLTLRRLLPEAKKMVDRGEISVKNAAALAKLPHKIQKNFVPHAVTTKGKEFEEIIRVAIKDWREFCQGNRLDWSEYRAQHATAYLRQMHEITAEADNRKAAGLVLLKMGAKTPMDGWRACMAWLLHLDPDSFDNQTKEKGGGLSKQLVYEDRRRENRKLINNLRRNSK